MKACKYLYDLEDGDGRGLPRDENAFREFFTGSHGMRLVVLNTCLGGRMVSAQALTGLAPKLLHRQIPAVLAMQYAIPDTSASIFAQEFYRCLELGYPVEAAICEGRRGMFLRVGAGQRDWATPVLFSNNRSGALFDLE